MTKTSHKRPIDLVPVRKEVLSPAEFTKLATDRPGVVARSRFVSPRIGKRDFGRFEVEYTIPILKRA